MARTRIRLNAEEGNAKVMAQRLEMSTAEIGLSVRTTNCLEERGIFTVQDLLNCTRDDLLSISNFGEKTLEEVYKALEGVGFYRQTPEPSAAPPERMRPRATSQQPTAAVA
ncbi:MAG: DNA-directed RNA polymerase subunit alpha [Planctomycetia bacterium]|nr:DNA-directed RNA polymerase subunit alpha [Planctomycetia bacterium]